MISRIKRFFLTILCLMLFTATFAQSGRVECEDTCRHIHGIDLSHYQGNVFWEVVGKTKMAYVYLKATEGGTRIDDKYKQNIDLAHSYGLKVGSYHFYRPRISQVDQLHNFMAQCRPGDQDLLPMIDVETRSGLPREEFRDSLAKFLVLVEKAYRQRPLVYTGTSFYNSNLQGLLDDYKLMIAQYSSRQPVLADGKEYILWQYTGKGHLDGINGYVDKSRFMGRHKLREIRFRHR